MGGSGPGITRYSEEPVVRAAGNIVLSKGMTTSIDQYAPIFLPVRTPLPNREAWQATVYRVTKSQTLLTVCVDARLLLACGSSAQ